MRKLMLGIALLVLLVSACGVEQELAPVPDESESYAHAAVEVGRVDQAGMQEFAAKVARMSPERRQDLWQELKVLHDKVHPSSPKVTSAVAVPGEGGGGCSPQRCSHSAGCRAAWCCAFGEDAVFYDLGGCPESLE